MSKRIFKYEGNGSESENQALDQFLKEAKGAERPFDYVVEASDQSAAGVVGRVNSEDGGSDRDKELFDQWQDQYNACGECPCDGMSTGTCNMFNARANDSGPDDCTKDCQGICDGPAVLDLDDACCMPDDKSPYDGLCYGCEDCSCACPDEMYSFSSNKYDNQPACYKEMETSCENGCQGAYGSLEECEEANGIDPGGVALINTITGDLIPWQNTDDGPDTGTA